MFAAVAIEDSIALPIPTADETLHVSAGTFEGWWGVFARDLHALIFSETPQHCRLVADRGAVKRTTKP
jgi:hypothetical protein